MPNTVNLLKEKIVTPVATSIAKQTKNEVRNGIILRKFIGVQIGETNTGCQLVKIDLNKISVKDPSYAFTLYIKAFSQYGTIGFIVNVKKEDSLLVSVNCDITNVLENASLFNIGYYDVSDNTITISMHKSVVTTTSITECKFVSTNNSLTVEDLTLDWSDTNTVKGDTSTNIITSRTSVASYTNNSLDIPSPVIEGLGSNETYKIATIDCTTFSNSPVKNNQLSVVAYISIRLKSPRIGSIELMIQLSKSKHPVLEGQPLNIYLWESFSSMWTDQIYRYLQYSDNRAVFGMRLVSNESSEKVELLINSDIIQQMATDHMVVESVEIYPRDVELENDSFSIDWSVERTSISEEDSIVYATSYDINRMTSFTDIIGATKKRYNGLVPAPNDTEISKGYFLKADGTWGAASNEINVIHTLDKSTILENEAYVLGKMNFSKLIDYGFESNPIIVIKVELTSAMVGNITLNFRVQWNATGNKIGISVNSIHTYYNAFGITDSEERISVLKTSKLDDTTIAICYNPDCLEAISGTKEYVIIHSFESYVQGETLKNIVTASWSLEKIDTTLNTLQNISTYDVDYYRLFQASDLKDVRYNGLVPHPTTSEAENKYLLGADAKWHPRKAVNDSFVELVPDDTIKGLDIEDITKAVSFVTFDFTNIIAKLTELSKSSTSIPFEMDLRTASSGDHHIDGNFTVNKSGLIPTTAYITPLSKKGAPIGYLENPSEFYGEVIDNPCFYIMDNTLKTVTFALYTPFADSSVCIKDFYIHIDESIASLSDILIEWKLIAIDKPGWAPLKVQKFTNGSILPLTRTFEQMNIETPIDEADSFTLEKERVKNNGLVPAPGKYEVNNGYVLGADAKWHPRKAGNEYIANLKPTEEIKGLSETDNTKGISFVTFDFNALSQKVVEAAPSTVQEFMINMKVLTHRLGIITISTGMSVTTAGLVACSGVLSDRGMGSHSVSFSTTYSGKLGAVVSPGFFVNDMDTKICKIALYTPIAIDGVKIIDAVVTSYSDIIDESDITFTWELGILEKKPVQLLRSNIIYPRIDLDRELVFDQMNIETPISETDEDTLFAEQIKHNGLVPAPGKYEVNNQYFLKADGTWDLPKNSINDYIALVTPSEEMADQTGTTTGVSFVTIDYSKAYEKLSLGTNETTGFRLYLTIFNETYGKLEIALRTIIVNLGENINQGVIAYADIGTGGSSVQLGQVQSNYGEDIRTPIFTDIDPTTHKIRVGIYAVGTNKPVIVKNCTIHQTHDTIDTHDINILWEASVVTFSEENTTSASQYINMNWNRAFSPILWMMNPEGSYSDSQVRKWRSDYNGFVPAPAKYEADQGRVLCADGSWIPTRGNNNSVSVVTPTEEMTSQVSSTVGITFVTFDYSKIIESLSLAVNTGSGFEGILVINTKLFGEILINFSVNLFNLDGTINKNATAYANVGTKSTDHNSQISSIQNTYGADIKTPVFIYTDSINNICKVGLYGSASKSPVIIKDCTLNQTYTDFDVNDITITWEPTTITISEETTNDAPLFTNMDWSKIFTPIANMTDPDGSYSENNLRRWKLQNNGLVPAPAKYEADQGKVLRADGTWGYQKKPLNDMLATVSPSDENIESYNAAKETKRISFVTIDFTNVMNKVSSGMWSGKLHFDVSENNFGTTHLYLQFIVNKTMCNVNIFSTLGTNPVDNNSSAISNLMDYGVETSSPIFVTNEGDSKNIVRIGFNGVSAIRSISILDCYIDSPYDITIDDLVISWESSIIDTTLVNKYINSKVISYMDSGDIFSSISNITSPSMIESTNAKTLKMYKLMNNGFVPAPYQYEADQRYVLYADGTWGSIEGIIRNRTFTVTPYTDSSSTQTNDYLITEGAEDLAIAINENYSVDINIVFSGLGSKNNTNTTLRITGVTGTINLYDCSGNPIKYITDGMSMKCTIFKNTIDDPVESMNAYCIYDVVSYPNTINGPSE